MTTARTLAEHLREAPFALGMSAGFFSFFAHTGFLTVLEDEGLVPTRLAGASAGALVAGAWAAGVDAPAIADELLALERSHFWDPAIGPGLLRGRLFHERLSRLLPHHTFERCRAPVAMSIFDVLGRKTTAIDRGDLVTAIRASCAVPFLFHPVTLEGRRYWDGGLFDRPGLLGMPREEPRVLFHHIASRSPWRMKKSELPKRPNMVTLVIDTLPRSGPFRLDEGRRAFKVAREATKRALDKRIENGLVVV